MLRLRINGQDLVLFPGTETQIEEKHPILNEDLQDAFSLEFDIPVRGNEAAFGHAQQIALRGRILRIDGAELWVGGDLKHIGVLHILGSSSGPGGSFTCSFSVDGFFSAIKGKKLRDVDYGPDIHFDDIYGLSNDASSKNLIANAWPTSRYCYPMIHNPEAYGNNNEEWYKEAADYDDALGYDVDDRMRYTPDTPVRRKRDYICIGTAPAGENPDNTPWDWQFFGQGNINTWDPTAGSGAGNWVFNLTKNEACFCPQFYLKDILTRAMAWLGFTADGSFMQDYNTHTVIVWNNRLLDKASSTNHVLASQSAPQNLAAVDLNHSFPSLWSSNGATLKLVCTDETTVPNEDPDGVWDGTNYTISAAGQHIWKIRLNITSAANLFYHVGIFRTSDDSRIAWALVGSDTDMRQNWSVLVQISHEFDAGDIGDDFHIKVNPRNWFTDHGTGTAVGSVPFTLSECYVDIARGDGDLENVGDNVIHPADHVPDITIEQLLLEVRDTWHLRIVPDHRTKRIHFDYQEDILAEPILGDLTKQVAGPTVFAHQDRVTGLRCKVSTGRPEDLPDLSGHFDDGEIDTETTLVTPASDLHTVYVRNSATVLVSKLYDANKYAWFPVGTLHRDAQMGEMDNPREVEPEFAPPNMDWIPAHGGVLCLMPVIKEPCSSPMFGMGNNPPGLFFMNYLGMMPDASNTYTYPMASPLSRDGLGGQQRGFALHFDPEDTIGLWRYMWKSWARVLTTAESFITDLRTGGLLQGVRMPFGRFLLKSQLVLLDTITNRYSTDRPEHVINEVRLLRITEPTDGPK